MNHVPSAHLRAQENIHQGTTNHSSPTDETDSQEKVNLRHLSQRLTRSVTLLSCPLVHEDGERCSKHRRIDERNRQGDEVLIHTVEPQSSAPFEELNDIAVANVE